MRLVFIIAGALLGGLILYFGDGEFPMGVLAGFVLSAVIILVLAVYKKRK
jgi:uncharacterized membrane protein YfcA